MNKIIGIANINKDNLGIGSDNKLLCSLMDDMRLFRHVTLGSNIVYGISTLKSFPNMKPLKGRCNIVLTHDFSHIPRSSIENSDVSFYHEITYGEDGSISVVQAYSNRDKDLETRLIAINNIILLPIALTLGSTHQINTDCYICGGESIYSEFISYCDECYITKNNCNIEPDRYFPVDLDKDYDWEEIEFENNFLENIPVKKSGIDNRTMIQYSFHRYRNIHKKEFDICI